MTTLVWFKKSKGLDAKIDPVRHGYKADEGISDLEIAYNVRHDRTGRLSMRAGWVNTGVTASCHSLFCDGGECLFCTSTALMRLGGDYSSVGLRNLSSSMRMSHTQIGDKIYYMNGAERGYVQNGASYAWTLSAIDYGRQDTTRVVTPPPVGSLLCYFNGRIYAAQGNVLWGSEVYSLNAFDPVRGRMPFESNIVLLLPVKDGIYVGTLQNVIFLRGNDYTDFIYERKRTYGAIAGTGVYAEAEIIPMLEGMQDAGGLFTSSGGVLYGSAEGVLTNLTRYKVNIPAVQLGAGLLMGEEYIACLDPWASTAGLTLNLQLESLALAQWGNYNFNSMCKFNGKYLGANDSGIFVLGEEDKDGTTSIEAIARLALTDFGSRWPKRLGKVFVGVETEGRLEFIVRANEREDTQVEKFVTPLWKDNSQHFFEFTVGRDLMGQYFSLEIRNLDGNDFSVDEVLVDVQELKRRTRGR